MNEIAWFSHRLNRKSSNKSLSSCIREMSWCINACLSYLPVGQSTVNPLSKPRKTLPAIYIDIYMQNPQPNPILSTLNFPLHLSHSLPTTQLRNTLYSPLRIRISPSTCDSSSASMMKKMKTRKHYLIISDHVYLSIYLSIYKTTHKNPLSNLPSLPHTLSHSNTNP